MIAHYYGSSDEESDWDRATAEAQEVTARPPLPPSVWYGGRTVRL